jgi:hypothetical protein
MDWSRSFRAAARSSLNSHCRTSCICSRCAKHWSPTPRLCARNSDRREFDELRAAFDDQRDVFEKGLLPDSDYAEYYALIKRMDAAIDEGSGNPYILESLDRLRTHLQRLRRIAKRRPQRMLQTVLEHLAICAAIYDGDESAAAQATALHISNSLHNILAVMTDDVIGRTTFATPSTATPRIGDVPGNRWRRTGTGVTPRSACSTSQRDPSSPGSLPN